MTLGNVMVIGGSSGIGEAVAREALERGGKVTIAGRDRARLEAASARIGVGVQACELDATNDGAVAAFFAERSDIDHLVLSFSTGRAGGPFRQLAMANLRGALEGKLVAYLAIVQAALRSMRSAGSITLVGAGSAVAALPGTAGLAAVNGGLHATVAPLAVELAPLRVNAVAPGIIETPWWGDTPSAMRAGAFQVAAKAPAGRVGRAEDVAKCVALLLECEYVTGTVIPCDGGLRLRS